MGQMGFYDLANRYVGLDAKADPLVKLNAVVPWDDFRARLDAVWRRPPEERKSKAGRKPWDTVVMFKAIVLCELYNLSDEQFEYQLRDRLSFMRFLGLGLEDPAPDATTVWLYLEQLVRAGLVDELFDAFDAHLKAQGWLAMGGQMIDASIVPVSRQRNTRDENAAIKAGETPEGWADKPAKRRQKDTDARLQDRCVRNAAERPETEPQRRRVAPNQASCTVKATFCSRSRAQWRYLSRCPDE